MVYGLRPRNPNITYVDSNNIETDVNNHHQDYSRPMPRIPTKRRSATSSTTRAMRTEMLKRGVNSNATHRLCKRGRPSKKIADVNGGQQNKEANGDGQCSSMERSLSLQEDLSPNTENSLPPPERQSSSMERSSFLQEDQSPNTENGLPPPERHISSIESVPLFPEGESSSTKTILSWLIDCKIVEEDEKVYYKDDTKGSAATTGTITRAGILCSCCQEEISIWTFEKHAGSDLKQPYEHICLPKKGTYLKDCLTIAWYEPTEQKTREPFYSTNPNDGACLLCRKEENLIFCTNNKCCSAYHAFCMNMKRVPREWNCPYCICKYCGLECQQQPITCLQCDKIFHLECFNKFSKSSWDISSSRLYCSQSCKEIYEKLENTLAAGTNISESYSWRVIRPTDMIYDFHSAKTLHLENNLKVAVAFKLMNESFHPITDRHTGIDVVHGILFSRRSDLKRMNFSRFHTFVLEKDDAIICAASIRIHGRRVAEMPLIATDKTFRCQGMCSKLMTAIESYLRDLEVESLIIPAVPGTSEMWKLKFGFKELTRELWKEVVSLNIFMLPNSTKLYKDLGSRAEEPEVSNGNTKDDQTKNHNAQETEDENTERRILDLNRTPHEEYQQVQQQS